MKILKDFRDFAVRGNVLDMAVGIIIGTGFGKIVSSFVSDVIMPPVGVLLGRVNFSNLFIDLSGKGYPSVQEAKAAGAATINYGLFLNTVIDFTILAFVVFLVVSQFNRFKAKPAPAAPTTRECPFCTSIISKRAVKCPNCISELKAVPV